MPTSARAVSAMVRPLCTLWTMWWRWMSMAIQKFHVLLSSRKVGQNLRPVNQPLAGFRRSCRNVADGRDEDASIMIRVAFVIGDYPAEQRRLREEAARSYSSAEVEVGILSVPARPFDGLTPAEIQAAAPIFHEAFRQAEREGYDAV